MQVWIYRISSAYQAGLKTLNLRASVEETSAEETHLLRQVRQLNPRELRVGLCGCIQKS